MLSFFFLKFLKTQLLLQTMFSEYSTCQRKVPEPEAQQPWECLRENLRAIVSQRVKRGSLWNLTQINVSIVFHSFFLPLHWTKFWKPHKLWWQKQLNDYTWHTTGSTFLFCGVCIWYYVLGPEDCPPVSPFQPTDQYTQKLKENVRPGLNFYVINLQKFRYSEFEQGRS